MTFIEMPLGDAKEKEVVPEGEYDLIVEDAVPPPPGKKSVMVRLSIEGHLEAKAVFHHLALISSDDDEEKRNNKLLFGKAFCDAFSIPYEGAGFDLDDFPGAQGTIYLTQEEYQGIINNKIRLTT